MPTKKLSELVVKNARAPASGRLELWDAALPGFGLRITEKNARSWFVMYRAGYGEAVRDSDGRIVTGRKQRRLSLGNANVIGLAEAREAARQALAQVEKGNDPAVRRSSGLAMTGSFADAAYSYLERYVAKNTRPSTYKETKRIIDKEAIPLWGARPIGSLMRADVEGLLDRLTERGSDVQANRVLARLRTFFNWAVEQEAIAISPVERMKPRTKERARDRVMSDDEIIWFWQGCELIGWPFGRILQLLLLTAQRRDEVTTMEWSEFDLQKRIWTIPREKAKNDRAHEVPLSEPAVVILAALPRVSPKYLFTTTGRGPVSGFTKPKDSLDRYLTKARRRHLGLPEKDEQLRVALGLAPGEPLPPEIQHWIIHDLRRTAATGMAKMNIAPHVVDKILNHVSGTIQGVAAIYNRFGYLEERRAALEAWGRCVMDLVRPAESNVVAMRRQ